MELQEIEQLKETLLTCTICEYPAFHDNTDFHILPCQHTICEECVNGLVKRRKNRDPLLCPYCREPFNLPKSGKLPTFRYAVELSAELENASAAANNRVKSASSQNHESKPDGITRLRKFSCAEASCLIQHAGKNGKFYLHTSCNDTGLSYINVAGEAKINRFGNLDSHYACIVLIGELLYTANLTEGCIEVYKNEKLLRSWPHKYLLCSMCTKLTACPENQLRLTLLVHDHVCRAHYTESGNLVALEEQEPGGFYKIGWCNIEIPIKDSLWVFKCNDEHLWEIPMTTTDGTVYYKKPIKRCKIGDYTSVCKWGEDKILFTVGNQVKEINLANISSRKNNDASRKQRGRAAREVQPTVHNLLTSVYQESQRLHVSDDGYVVLQGGDYITSYKLSHLTQELPVEIVTKPSSDPKPSLCEKFCQLILFFAIFSLFLVFVNFVSMTYQRYYYEHEDIESLAFTAFLYKWCGYEKVYLTITEHYHWIASLCKTIIIHMI